MSFFHEAPASVRLVDGRFGAAVDDRVDVPAALVGRGVEDVRLARVHEDVRDPRVLGDLEDLRPGLAAVRGLVEPAVPARRPEGSLACRVDDLGVARVDEDLGDVLRRLEPHVLPGSTAVLRTVDAVAVAHAALAVVFPRAHPDHAGVLGVEGQAPDGVGAFLFEDRRPGGSGVDGLPHAARGRRHEIVRGIFRVHREVHDPARHEGRSDGAQFQAGEGLGTPGSLLLLLPFSSAGGW